MTLVPKFSGSSSGASGDSDMVDRQRYGNIRKMFGVLIFHFQTCATSKIHSDRFRRQLKTAVIVWNRKVFYSSNFLFWTQKQIENTTLAIIDALFVVVSLFLLKISLRMGISIKTKHLFISISLVKLNHSYSRKLLYQRIFPKCMIQTI